MEKTLLITHYKIRIDEKISYIKRVRPRPLELARGHSKQKRLRPQMKIDIVKIAVRSFVSIIIMINVLLSLKG